MQIEIWNDRQIQNIDIQMLEQADGEMDRRTDRNKMMRRMERGSKI